jgi:DNA-binding transcriptional regulator YhcF (GntR family)
MMSTPEPPYLRIAAAFRSRIAAGDLAVGDRLPSTRKIAAEWNVALATATKALTVLRQEGLVRAESRVGTVVAAPRRGPVREQPRPDVLRSTPTELTSERVVRAAIEIADAEGLSALSMRGVAARLGVATMSPYRHVGSKDDLVLLMADAAYGEQSYPAEPPSGWRPRLALAARTLWSLFRRHPWLVQISPLTRPLALPNLAMHAEWVLGALEGYGLNAATRMELHILVYSYVQGMAVNLEGEAQAAAATGMSEQQFMDAQTPRLQALVASGRYPAFAAVVAELDPGWDLHLDDMFEFGLGPMLDGLAVLIDRSAQQVAERAGGLDDR